MGSRRAVLLTSRPAGSIYPRLGSVRGPRTGFRWMQGVLARHLSIRGKLTLYYGLMCAATLAIAGVAMKTYTDSQFSHDIDSSLQNTASLVQKQIAQAPTITGPLSQAPFPADQAPCSGSKGPSDPRLQRYCYQIEYGLFKSAGQLYASGQFERVIFTKDATTGVTAPPVGQPGLPQKVLPPIDPLTFIRVGSTGPAVFYDTAYGGHALRVYVAPLDMPATLRAAGYLGIVQVVQDKHTYNQIQSRFDLTLLLVIPLGVITALIAGWWIARAALRPINRISRTVRAIGSSQDLTRRVDFLGPEDEIGRLAATFDGMMDRLESVFETQKRFVADASHELRTPLTAIRGNADLMSIAPSEEERQACLASIRSESQRMSRLVADLLLLAEADVAEQQLHTREVRLDELVREVYRSALVLAAGKVDVILDVIEPVSIIGDPDRLKQLVLNLADNAVKFTAAGGIVSLRVVREGNQARIDVSDSGIGIPRDEQDAIFQRFYRIEESRFKRGSGLGLAICSWITEAHGGSIQVKSEPGKGSTFTIYLPSLDHSTDHDHPRHDQLISQTADQSG